MAWFVYVKSFNGSKIEAQRFDHWPTVDGQPIKVEQQHELKEREMHCRLAYLIAKYPYKDPANLTQPTKFARLYRRWREKWRTE